MKQTFKQWKKTLSAEDLKKIENINNNPDMLAKARALELLLRTKVIIYDQEKKVFRKGSNWEQHHKNLVQIMFDGFQNHGIPEEMTYQLMRQKGLIPWMRVED